MRGKFSRCNVERYVLDIISFTSDHGADAAPKIKDVMSVTLGMCSFAVPIIERDDHKVTSHHGLTAACQCWRLLPCIYIH